MPFLSRKIGATICWTPDTCYILLQSSPRPVEQVLQGCHTRVAEAHLVPGHTEGSRPRGCFLLATLPRGRPARRNDFLLHSSSPAQIGQVLSSAELCSAQGTPGLNGRQTTGAVSLQSQYRAGCRSELGAGAQRCHSAQRSAVRGLPLSLSRGPAVAGTG